MKKRNREIAGLPNGLEECDATFSDRLLEDIFGSGPIMRIQGGAPMRRYLISTVVAALIASTSVALAAHKADGTIASIDTAKMVFTLQNGQQFKLPESWDEKAVQVGTKVTVTYEKNTDGNTASAIVPQSWNFNYRE